MVKLEHYLAFLIDHHKSDCTFKALKMKATAFASAQAEKVDELKRHLKKQKQKSVELEGQVQAYSRELARLRHSTGEQGMQQVSFLGRCCISCELDLTYIYSDKTGNNGIT